MKRCVFAVSMALAAGLPLAGFAAEYFVDAVHGSDSYDGTAAKWAGGESTVGPKKTVQAAVNLVANGNGTTITLLPGVYDEGGAENSNSYIQSNRVVVTKSNVTLRSSSGKAKDVHIVGRKSTAPGNDHGIGEGAMRCLAVNKNVSGVVAFGITFRDGASITTDTHRGGGIFSAGTLTIIDCVVSNCAAYRGGGANSIVAHSSLFTGNYAANMGAAINQCSLANCLIIHNGLDSGKSPVSYIDKAVNCTVARNGNIDAVFQGGAANAGDSIYNMLIFGHRNGNSVHPATDVYSSVIEGDGTNNGRSYDADTILDAVAAEECASPTMGDWRSLSTGHCANRGVGAYLGLVPMPEGYTYHDMAGNVIDTNGTVTVGAYQEVATPAAARLVFGAGYEVEGSPYPRWETGGWITPLVWPVAYRVRWYQEGTTYAIYFSEENSGTDRNFYHAGYDGWTTIVPWHDVTATNTLMRQSCTNRFYVDAVNGSDDYDGTAATWAGGESKVGPKKTIQAAADTNAVISGYTFVYVAPGVYGEGGAFVNSSSNRVYDYGRPIGFIASAGPGTATIVGAPDPITKGLGDNAMRCVYLAYKLSFLQGFNVMGGYTANKSTDAFGGGGVKALNLSQLIDCTITNNHAAYAGGVMNGTLIRCRIVGNTADRAAAVRSSSLYRCVVDGNNGPSKILDACKKVDSCTIGPDARKTDGTAASQVLYNTETPVVNSLVLASSFQGTSTYPPRATNCVFVIKKWSAADTDTADCIFTNLAAVACNEDFRPIVGANVGIDRADDSLSYLPFVWTPDLSRGQGVMNGARDLGALEADWRPKYAEDLDGRCTVSAVSPEIRENAEGHVYLPSGTLEGSFDAMSKASRRQLGVRVTGNGTLTVTVAGEVVGEFTANGGDVQNSTLKLSAAGDAFTFAYVPGKNDMGGAEIVECSRLVGSAIVIR